MQLKLNTEATTLDLQSFDSVVVATGVLPRAVKIPVTGAGARVKVLSYIDVLKSKCCDVVCRLCFLFHFPPVFFLILPHIISTTTSYEYKYTPTSLYMYP